jgi:hypothetical protein
VSSKERRHHASCRLAWSEEVAKICTCGALSAPAVFREASVSQGVELADTLTAMARRCDNWIYDQNAGYDAATDLISSLMNELDQAAESARALSSAPGERT